MCAALGRGILGKQKSGFQQQETPSKRIVRGELWTTPARSPLSNSSQTPKLRFPTRNGQQHLKNFSNSRSPSSEFRQGIPRREELPHFKSASRVSSHLQLSKPTDGEKISSSMSKIEGMSRANSFNRLGKDNEIEYKFQNTPNQRIYLSSIRAGLAANLMKVAQHKSALSLRQGGEPGFVPRFFEEDQKGSSPEPRVSGWSRAIQHARWNSQPAVDLIHMTSQNGVEHSGVQAHTGTVTQRQTTWELSKGRSSSRDLERELLEPNKTFEPMRTFEESETDKTEEKQNLRPLGQRFIFSRKTTHQTEERDVRLLEHQVTREPGTRQNSNSMIKLPSIYTKRSSSNLIVQRMTQGAGLRTGSTVEQVKRRNSLLNSSTDSVTAQVGIYETPRPFGDHPEARNDVVPVHSSRDPRVDSRPLFSEAVLNSSDLKLQIFKMRAKQSIGRLVGTINTPQEPSLVQASPNLGGKQQESQGSVHQSDRAAPVRTKKKRSVTAVQALTNKLSTLEALGRKDDSLADGRSVQLQISVLKTLELKPVSQGSLLSHQGPKNLQESTQIAENGREQRSEQVRTVAEPLRIEPRSSMSHKHPADRVPSSPMINILPAEEVHTPGFSETSLPDASEHNTLGVSAKKRRKISWSPRLEQVNEHPFDGESKLSEYKQSQVGEGESEIGTNQRVDNLTESGLGAVYPLPLDKAGVKQAGLKARIGSPLQKLGFVSRLKTHIKRMVNRLQTSKESKQHGPLLDRLVKSLDDWMRESSIESALMKGPTVLSFGTLSSLYGSQNVFTKIKELAQEMERGGRESPGSGLKWSVHTEMLPGLSTDVDLARKVSLKLMINLDKLTQSGEKSNSGVDVVAKISELTEEEKRIPTDSNDRSSSNKKNSIFSKLSRQSGFHEVFQIDFNCVDPFAVSEHASSYIPSRQQLDLDQTLMHASRGDASIGNFKFVEDDSSSHDAPDNNVALKPKRASTSVVKE